MCGNGQVVCSTYVGFLTFQGQVSLSLLMQIIFMSSFLSLMGNKFTTFSTNSIKKQKICSTNNIVFVYYRNSQFGTCVHILFVLRTFSNQLSKLFLVQLSYSVYLTRNTLGRGQQLNSGCRHDRLLRDFLKRVLRGFLGYSYFYYINFYFRSKCTSKFT